MIERYEEEHGAPAPPRLSRHRVLVIYLGDLTHIARVLRQIEFLEREFDVVVAAFGAGDELPGVEFIKLSATKGGRGRARLEAASRCLLRQAARYHAAYWLDERVRSWRLELRQGLPVDAVIVNDPLALPLVFEACGGAPVVFDAHEHWTSESASWTLRTRISMRGASEWIVDRYASRVAAMMTVSPGIVDEYRARTGRTPALVTNAPFYQSLTPSPVAEPIRLLHVGFADERRRLELTLDAVRSLTGRFTLDLVLARNPDYQRRLKSLIASADNIRILPPVPAGDVISFASAYDIGVHLLPADNPNLLNALPNKLFDYIQARLAVAIGPSPEMARIVREWECGVVAEAFSSEALVAVLERLTPDAVSVMKRNSDRAARILNADRNCDEVLRLVRDAIGSGTRSVCGEF